jgi:hypothetical protein
MTALRLIEGSRSQSIDAAEFPLAVAVAGHGLVVGGPAEAMPALRILFHQRGLSIAPEPGRAVTYNGARLEAPTLLRDGDELAIGNVAMTAVVQDGTVTLRVTSAPSQAPDQTRRFGTRLGAAQADRHRTPFATATKIALAMFAVLLTGVAYVITASPLTVRITPEPESVSVSGWLPPVPMGDRYLAFPGSYVLEAEKEGYKPLRANVQVPFGVPRMWRSIFRNCRAGSPSPLRRWTALQFWSTA